MTRLLKSLLIIALLNQILIQSSGGVPYYIKPSDNDCLSEDLQPCLTLLEFATNLTSTESNISLIIYPGLHRLSVNLSLSNIDNFELSSQSDESRVIIDCESSSQISLDSVESVSVNGVNFIGCGGNIVRNVRHFFIEDSTFEGRQETGTSLILINTTAEIVNCSFTSNQFGTVMESVESLQTITDNIVWLIVRNVTGLVRVGGALISTGSNVSISHTRFSNNSADIGGNIYIEQDSNVSIFNTTFTGNGLQPDISKETAMGGGIFSYQSNISIVECQFCNNHATVGASIMSSLSNVSINGSIFDSNTASDHAGGLFVYNSTAFVYRSTFNNNSALGGAGITTDVGVIDIIESIFTFNTVEQHGGAVDIGMDTASITACYFEGNVAHSFAGAVLLWGSTGEVYGSSTQECGSNCSDSFPGAVNDLDSSIMSKTQFISNSAPTGAALYAIKSTIKSCGPIIFSQNYATLSSSVYFLNSIWQFQGYIELSRNLGSLFAHKSNITISGCAKFANGSPPQNTTATFKEGGALTVYQTTLNLQGQVRFENNRAEIGGALVAMESEVYLNDKVYVHNNSASVSGGGLYLSQSELIGVLESSVNISNNYAAENGGGIHAVSTLIYCIVTGAQYTDMNGNRVEKYKGCLMYVTENSARKGGGIYVEANTKISVLKDYVFSAGARRTALNFIRNYAYYGGALYVDDATNSGTCASNPFELTSPKSECFISVVSTETIVTTNTNFSLNNVMFDRNNAKISGDTLFGGLLDRCIVSPFNEVDRTIDRSTNQLLSYNGSGLQYLMDISSETVQSISSFPVQVCPCVNGLQNCGYNNLIGSIAQVKKGHFFNISLIAVDQVYRPVNATIQGQLNSAKSNLLYGQVTDIPDKCTDVSFQISSPFPYEELALFASDGPCNDAELSTLRVEVAFLPCTCPIGFTPSDAVSENFCSCICDSKISSYVTQCNSGTQSFKRAENVWISYFNGTNTSGYVVHQYCPFDYCTPPNISNPIDLNQPDGSDAQCALNRTGMLCGGCKPGLSLSLGSSKCLQCPSYWPALAVSITVFSILAGLGLIVLFLWLNITVAVGTLNGLLFYANVVAANRVILLPYPEPNFITVFISWLNLELGIDVCYFDGMDMYMKTWLQLAFPIYIIILVILLIVISRYSSRFSQLISRRNPVATLATLILISYGKLFHVVLLAQPFSYAVLTYPDNTTSILWLPDGTVGYLNGKHIVLFAVALLILVACIGYSLLLLCWQLILRTPDWKIFKCIKSPTLTLFMEAYHVPYTAKHRYWTGLLLLVRAIIYLIATANVSGNPQIQLISIIFIMSCVILLKLLIATKIFKKWLIDSLESFFYFNIIFLASFTSYNLSTGNSQDGVAYTSVVLSILVTLMILTYHFYKYTSVFSVIRNSSIVANLKEALKPKQKTNQQSNTGFTNSLFREGDISLDISISDSDYHNVNSSSAVVISQQQHQRHPTVSVVEMN